MLVQNGNKYVHRIITHQLNYNVLVLLQYKNLTLSYIQKLELSKISENSKNYNHYNINDQCM